MACGLFYIQLKKLNQQESAGSETDIIFPIIKTAGKVRKKSAKFYLNLNVNK